MDAQTAHSAATENAPSTCDIESADVGARPLPFAAAVAKQPLAQMARNAPNWVNPYAENVAALASSRTNGQWRDSCVRR